MEVSVLVGNSKWLDSDLIPRLLKILDNLKKGHFVQNDAYRRILSAWACRNVGVLVYSSTLIVIIVGLRFIYI